MLDLNSSIEPFFHEYQNIFFEKVKNGYKENDVKTMKEHGLSDDSIFLAHLLGIYKGSIEMGLI